MIWFTIALIFCLGLLVGIFFDKFLIWCTVNASPLWDQHHPTFDQLFPDRLTFNYSDPNDR